LSREKERWKYLTNKKIHVRLIVKEVDFFRKNMSMQRQSALEILGDLKRRTFAFLERRPPGRGRYAIPPNRRARPAARRAAPVLKSEPPNMSPLPIPAEKAVNPVSVLHDWMVAHNLDTKRPFGSGRIRFSQLKAEEAKKLVPIAEIERRDFLDKLMALQPEDSSSPGSHFVSEALIELAKVLPEGQVRIQEIMRLIDLVVATVLNVIPDELLPGEVEALNRLYLALQINRCAEIPQKITET
jgi:hypothetical protein